MMDRHSRHSSFREKTLEHLFVGAILRVLWQRGIWDAEVLRADVDGAGYDVVIDAAGVLRHIQLKASIHGSKVTEQNINVKLASKPSGCVVWMHVDPETLDLGPFHWFGGAPGDALPDITRFRTARHSRGNAAGEKKVRDGIFLLKRTSCEPVETIGGVVDRLFGPDAGSFRPAPSQNA